MLEAIVTVAFTVAVLAFVVLVIRDRQAKARACNITGLEVCPWHPDGGPHPHWNRPDERVWI